MVKNKQVFFPLDETRTGFRNAQCIFLESSYPIVVWIERMLMKCVNSFLICSCADVNLYYRQYEIESVFQAAVRQRQYILNTLFQGLFFKAIQSFSKIV